MGDGAIGKLERVPLREVWKHEALDFTHWLQENIDVLNSALDLTLVNVDREQAAGSFSIDLVAEDEGGGTVIIENQLEKSNHDHLGKLITYDGYGCESCDLDSFGPPPRTCGGAYMAERICQRRILHGES